MNRFAPLLVPIAIAIALFIGFSEKTDLKENPTLPIMTQAIPEPTVSDIKEPEFVDVAFVTQRVNEDSIYADIMNHCKSPFTGHSRATNAHESTHGINSTIRNEIAPRGCNGFYVGNGKGVIVEEPNFRKRDIIEFLPKPVRSYRYKLYVLGLQDWDDMPTYIFDEWVAYVNGAQVAIEDASNDKNARDANTDAVSGTIGFSIYSVAVAMACEKHDPEYWKTNDQFKNFITWHLQKSYDTFSKGYKMPSFIKHGQEKVYRGLLNSPEAEPMRQFIRKHFNGIWLDGEVAEEFKATQFRQQNASVS